MNELIGVYCITNKINNKSYIGISHDIAKRWRGHIYESQCYSGKSYEKALYRAFRKYGIDNFDFKILEECENIEIASNKEVYWINILDTKNNGYNEIEGGLGCSDRKGDNNGRAKLTEEDVIKIRTARKNKENRREVYEKYGNNITFQSFINVWQGVNWKHIMPEIYTSEAIIKEERNKERARGSQKSNTKLTEFDVFKIRQRKINGEIAINVHKDYKHLIGQTSFYNIWNNTTWKHVQLKSEEEHVIY